MSQQQAEYKIKGRKSTYIVSSAFPEPNYTQTPNSFFDMIPDMEGSEIAVTLIMIRNTFGFHRANFKMGLSKLEKATGLSRNSVKAGAEAAEARGTFKRVNPDGQGEAEWELMVGQSLTPLENIDESVIDLAGSQPLIGGESVIDSQVGVKESIKEKKNKKEITPNVVVVKAARSKNSSTATTTFEGVNYKNPLYFENLEMCARMAITQPQASLIADARPLSGVEVTPEFIKQHVETLAVGETIGLAITRIKAGELPRGFKPGAPIEEQPTKEYIRYSQVMVQP